MVKRTLAGLLCLSLLMSCNPLTAKASTDLKEEQKKELVGTYLLSKSGYNFNSYETQEIEGVKCFNYIKDTLKVGVGEEFVNYTDEVSSRWNGKIQVSDDTMSKVVEYANTIPTTNTTKNYSGVIGMKQLVGYIDTNKDTGKLDIPVDTILSMAYNGNDGLASKMTIEIMSGNKSILERELHYDVDGTRTGTARITVNSEDNASVQILDSNGDRLQEFILNLPVDTSGPNINVTNTSHYSYEVYIKNTLSADVSFSRDMPVTYLPKDGVSLNKLKSNIGDNRTIDMSRVRYNKVPRNLTESSIIPGMSAINSSGISSSTITINAKIEPYLEVNLDTTEIVFDNTTVGSDLDHDIVANVKSNLNYNMIGSYTGLSAEGEATVVADKYFYISDGNQKYNPVKDIEFNMAENNTLGDSNHTFKLGITTGIDLLPKRYNTTFSLKVSQL